MNGIRRRIYTSLCLISILSLFLNVLKPLLTSARLPVVQASSETSAAIGSPEAPAFAPTPAPKSKATPTPVPPKSSAPKGSPCTPSTKQPLQAPPRGAAASVKQPTLAGELTLLDCPSSLSLAAATPYTGYRYWFRTIDPYSGTGYSARCPSTRYYTNRVYPTDTCVALDIQTAGVNDNDKFTWYFHSPDGSVRSAYWQFYAPSNPSNWCAANYPSWPYEWYVSTGMIYCAYMPGGTIGIALLIQCTPGSYCDPTTTPGYATGEWPTEVVYTDASNNSTTIVTDSFLMLDGIAPDQAYATEQRCMAADPENFQGSAADPVNPFSGNFTEQFVDLSIPARGFPLSFERSYNSLDAANTGPLGYGWTHNYNMRLTFTTLYSVTVASLIGARGSHLNFTRNDDGTFMAMPGVRAQLTQNPDGTYTAADSHQNRYALDGSGRLTQISDSNGNVQTFTYNGSTLTAVSDASGRSLAFGYDGNGRINQITDPLSRTVGYGYDGSGNLTSVIDTRGFITTMTYDGNHHLLTVVDANQRTQITNHYDAQNRVDYQLDALSQQTTFAYTPGMTQTVVTDRRSNATTFKYNSATHLLSSVVDALGHSESYTYDGYLNRASVTDRNGHQTQFTWSASGCALASVTDAQGNTASFSYDGNNNLTSTFDPYSRETRFSYDANNNLLFILKPIAGSMSFGYDGWGQLTSKTDENVHTTSNGYDTYGNRTAITDTLNHVTNMSYDLAGRLTDLTDALGRRTHYEYDAGNHVTLAVLNYDSTRGHNEGNQYNLTTQYGYDAVGNLTLITNTLDLVTKTDYDALNRPQTVTVNYVSGGPSDSQTNLTTIYGYDANGNRQTVTDAKTQTTRFDYDAVDRLSGTTDPLNHTTQYVYDAAGNQTQVVDANNNSARFTYDSVDRVIAVTDGVGNQTQYGYDAIGNRTSITDALGIVTALAYDNVNRLTSVTENYRAGQGSTASQNVATSYAYDNVGNLIRVTDANAHPTTYSYDELDRLQTTQDVLGHITTNWYDAVGNLQTRVDANNATTSYVYDGVERLVQINYPTSSVAFAYDALGHRQTMLDSAGLSQYGYDAVYRLNTVTDPFNQSVGYGYDRAGNRVGLTYPDGKSVSYGYDAANLLKTVTDWNTQTTQYAYDNANRLTNATLPNGVSIGYAYDKANRLTLMEYDRGTTLLGRVGYALDAVGNRTQQSESFVAVESGALAPNVVPTLPNHFYLPLVGADSGSAAPKAVPTPTRTLTKTAAPSATRQAPGEPRVTLMPRPQSTSAREVVPGASRATSSPTPTATLTRNATPLALNLSVVSYLPPEEESGSANLAPATKTPTLTPTPTNTPTPTATALPAGTNNTVIDYVYDPLYRLTQAKYSTYGGGPLSPMLLRSLAAPGKATNTPTATPIPTATPNPPLGTLRTIAYTYDAVGNRLTQDDNGALSSYGYDIANRLTSVNGQAYTFDNNGNLLSDGTRTFQYDIENRLIAVTSPSSASSFVNNGLGDRLQQTVNGAQTRYALDPAAGLTQVLADGTNTYLYGLGRIAQQQTTMQYFGVDGLGSVRQLYNSTGQIVANHRYDPFGNTISQSGLGTSAYGYAGEQQDPSGLDYLRARYYDPVTGRFLSKDAWGESVNGWTYAENNPILFTDPSGLCTSGIGNDTIWAGLNSDFTKKEFWGQIQAGLNANWQECQQNWNKAQAAWGKGNYGQAVSYATGFTSDMQRAAGWVNDNNRDWEILRDDGCSRAVRQAAGERIFGRGFELAGWLVGAGGTAKTIYSKARLANKVLAEAEEEGLAYRYVGSREAAEVKLTGKIPATDLKGNPKNVFTTPNYFESAGEAQEALQLGKAPTHRITYPFRAARYNYAGNVENGSAIEMTTNKPIPALRVDPLNE